MYDGRGKMYYFSVPFSSSFLHLCTSTLTNSSQSVRWKMYDDVCEMYDV